MSNKVTNYVDENPRKRICEMWTQIKNLPDGCRPSKLRLHLKKKKSPKFFAMVFCLLQFYPVLKCRKKNFFSSLFIRELILYLFRF